VTDIIVSVLLATSLIGAYALLAIGIVAIYQASKVLNLAHGTMAMVPAYVVYSLSKVGVPLVPAVLLGVVSGGALGWAVERVFVRPLRGESETAQTVGTVAALGLILSVTVRIWGTTPQRAVAVFPTGGIDVGRSSIRYGELGLFVTMIVIAAALYTVFRYSDFGIIIRGTAENRRAASLMGVNPQRVTNAVWMIGGALAGLAGILLAAITNLSPYTLSLQALPAFVAALIGGLGSFPGAVAGGATVGLAFGFVPRMGGLGHMQGAPQFVLACLAIAAMAVRGSGLSGSDIRASR